LALFGRRSPQRVDSLVMPASENLHNSGLMQRSKIGGYSITSSARASMDLLCKNRASQTEQLHGLLWSPSGGLF
jgi:hypothetical protein